MVFNFLEFINEKSVNLIENDEAQTKNEVSIKKTMWQMWRKIIFKNMIALAFVAAMYALYIISLGT